MAKLISQIFGSVIKGIPLIGTIKKKIFPSKIKQVNILGESKDVVVQDEHKQSQWFWLLKLIAEAGGVFLFIYLMKTYNVSYDDILYVFTLVSELFNK